MRRTSRIVLAIACLLCACDNNEPPAPAGGPTGQEQPTGPELHVYAADAVEPPLRDAADAFTRETGVRVNLYFMKAANAVESMARREEGDVFVPATRRAIRTARDRGLLSDDPVRTVTYLSIAIGVRPGNPKNVRTLADLARPDVAGAMGDPERATVGEMAVRVLDRIPNGREIAAAMVERGECCSTTLELLRTGRADAVLGWDCYPGWAPGEVETIPLPLALREYIEVPAAIVRFSRDPATAHRFVQFLASAEGAAIFRARRYAERPVAAVEPLAEGLPTPLAGSSAFWDGRAAYIVGGDTPAGRTDAILRFDPSTGRSERAGASLPGPRRITSVAWDGAKAYLFGGSTPDCAVTDEILVFDPRADTARPARSRLPSPRGRTAAVYDGRFTYVLGGNTGVFTPTGYLDEILRFDPATEEVTVLPARLPTPRASRIAAAWDGRKVYLFGGMVEGGKTDEIVEFDPAEGRVSVVPARLPAAWDGGVVLFDGARFLLFGGMTTEAPAIDAVWAWTPGAPQVEVLRQRLPAARKGQSAVWTGREAVIFGGRAQEGLSGQILVHVEPVFAPF